MHKQEASCENYTAPKESVPSKTHFEFGHEESWSQEIFKEL